MRKLIGKLRRYGPVVTSALATAAISGSSLLFSKHKAWAPRIFLASVVVFVFSAIVLAADQTNAAKTAARVAELIEENSGLRSQVRRQEGDYFERFRAVLHDIGRELGLTRQQRISFFRFRNGIFVMLARYAENPNFDRSGRKIYSTEQGAIGKAWADGSVVIGGLPDPRAKWDDYVKAQEKWGVSREECQRLTMRSRSYLALAVADSANDRSIGVVVVESEKSTRLGYLEPKLAGSVQPILHFVKKNAHLEPDPEAASRRGI